MQILVLMYVDSKTRLAFFNEPAVILVGGELVMAILKRNAETQSTRRRNDWFAVRPVRDRNPIQATRRLVSNRAFAS